MKRERRPIEQLHESGMMRIVLPLPRDAMAHAVSFKGPETFLDAPSLALVQLAIDAKTAWDRYVTMLAIACDRASREGEREIWVPTDSERAFLESVLPRAGVEEMAKEPAERVHKKHVITVPHEKWRRVTPEQIEAIKAAFNAAPEERGLMSRLARDFNVNVGTIWYICKRKKTQKPAGDPTP